MKTTIKFFVLLAAVLTLAACDKENEKESSKDLASPSQVYRLSRVIMDKSGVHTEYNYTWDGNLLTSVVMEEDGILNTALITYEGSQRTALQLYDNNNILAKEYHYYYNGDLLSREYQTDYGNTPSPNGLIQDWRFYGGYLNYVQNETRGLDFLYHSDSTLKGFILSGLDSDSLSSLNYNWNNGDLVSIVSLWDVFIIGYDYDTTTHPYGVSLGTTTLIPGYNTYIPWRSQWSRHNLTHIYGQTEELRISYTYDSAGRPATAEMTWTDGSLIHWTFEYND